MLYKLLAFIMLVVPAFGVTASPSTIHLYSRLGAANPWYSTAVPPETTIAISGSGSWSISRGGTLNTECGAAWGYCFNAVTTVTSSAAGAVPTGSGAGSVILSWRGMATQELSLGDHTGTLTIGSTTINITLTVLPNQAYDKFVYRAGFPLGCSNSNAGYPHLDTCTPTNERPTSNSFVVPAPGGSYVDPQFGYTVNRVTASGFVNQYGAVTAFSANSTYVLTADALLGNVNVFPRVGGSPTYAAVPGLTIDMAAWDPSNDEKLWYFSGGTIKYRILNTGSVTTAADYTSSSGSRPAMSTIDAGGTGDITGDGWWVFRGLGTEVCAVNLNGLTTGNQESKTTCVDISSLALTDFDFPAITQVDSESGKRYVLIMGEPHAHVYSVGTSTLNYEFQLGDITDPHSGVGQDAAGRQFVFYSWTDIFGSRTYLATLFLSKGADLQQPIETGGGLRLVYPNQPIGDDTTDGHFGCSWVKFVCIFSPYGNSGGITATAISAVTAGSPCAITSTGHGLTSGDSVLIGGALGITSINGVFTTTVTGANTYTTGVPCSGTYTANSAHMVKNVSTAADSPNRQELVVVRPGQEVRRIAIHRAKTYHAPPMISYYTTPRASLSRDACWVAFQTNWGVPEYSSVAVVETGLCDPLNNKISFKSAAVADTSAILNYQVPAGEGAATITVSASPNLGSPVVSASDAKASASRQYVVTGLTADTEYYFRIFSGLYSFTGRFRTAPTLSGTSRLVVKSGNGTTILHGTTSALGSSSSSPLDVTVSKGIYYYNAGGQTQAVVVR